jgi:hypothetical protein
MTQPPLPAPTTTMRPCRPERNLTPNAQSVSEAVPLPAFSLLQEAQLSRRSGHPGRLVKNVRNSFCTTDIVFSEVNTSPQTLFTESFTSLFTLKENLDHSPERAYLRFKCGSCTGRKHRTGLERPHFVATEPVAVAPAQLEPGTIASYVPRTSGSTAFARLGSRKSRAEPESLNYLNLVRHKFLFKR